MAISGRSVINAPDFLVDPRLILPPSVANTGYTEALDDSAGVFTDTITPTSGTDIISGAGDGVVPTAVQSALPIPDSMIVIGQTIRIVPGGGIVVDVEVEVTDVNNIGTYEVRLAKL